MDTFKSDIITVLEIRYCKNIHNASRDELYYAVSIAAMKKIKRRWLTPTVGKKVCFFSAEYLPGRLIHSNLLNLGLFNQFSDLLRENNIDADIFGDIEEAPLGSGGLGRLAVCFLDSAATQNIALNGYGIRYKYGFFRQYFENGFQREEPDDWRGFDNPWSLRREDCTVSVKFKDQTVCAVPYDTPVIGYGGQTVNTLRLWQAEPERPFDFQLFIDQKYDVAVRVKDDAEAISSVLYPNASTDRGKKLKLKQEYFFTSASLQDMIVSYKKRYGKNFAYFPSEYAVQLNDTAPVVSIPEFIRLLVEEEGVSFNKALQITYKVFSYTNHTVTDEFLENWDVKLFKSVLPHVYRYVVILNRVLQKELTEKGIDAVAQNKYLIIEDNAVIHMERLAVFASHATNGVCEVQTEILKSRALKEWYELYPERFSNKTNGITQRRWLALANPELSEFISEKIGNAWTIDLEQLKKLEKYKDDTQTIRRFEEIKRIKKQQLADYIEKHENVKLDANFIFDIQVKRLHENNRQLLNALAILDIYFGIKDGRIQNFTPTAFIFGAKATPGYFRAKSIIKFINEIAGKINNDPAVNDLMKVVFITNYNVSYAEKIMPAADISEQISTLGTEASSTGNMKFMLNGAVTLGTYDGSNVEIIEQAGKENNYIFGVCAQRLEKDKHSYSARETYLQEPSIRAVLDSLINGMFNDSGTGMFLDLYKSILGGINGIQPDAYFLLYDFNSYCTAKMQANSDYQNRFLFTQKCFLNTANAGGFSSDRSIREYASQIWGV